MNKQGISLAEVIIAALILSITIGGLLYIFTTEKGVVLLTGRRVQAMDFARQRLEELKNAVDAETWPNTGDLGTTGIAISAPILPGESSVFRDKFGGTRHYEVTNVDADGDMTYEDDEYKSVTVNVGWTDPMEH